MKMNWEDRMKVENEIVSVSQACQMKCSFEMVRYPTSSPICREATIYWKRQILNQTIQKQV